MATQKFSIDSTKLAGMDILKNYNFHVYILNAPKVGGQTQDEMFIRCRGVTIPERTIEQIESFFMGQSQRFAGRTVFGANFTITVEEFEDQLGIDFFHQWQQKIHNIETGLAELETKAQYSSDIEIVMFKHGKKVSPFKVRIKKAWCSQIPSTTLNHETNEGVKYEIQFTCDRWDLVKNS